MHGTLKTRNDGYEDYIDGIYNDHSKSKFIFTNKNFDFTMGIINHRGVFIAKVGDFDEEYDYMEEDETKMKAKSAKLKFKPARGSDGWTLNFPYGENIVLFTASDLFAAVLTSEDMVRLISPGGSEYMNISGQADVVTMTSYENLLAIFYHASNPLSKRQAVKAKCIDVITMRVLFDSTIPLRGNHILKWAGFSDRGILHV